MLQHKTPAQLSHVHKNGTNTFLLQNVSMDIQYDFTENNFCKV